MRLGMVVLLLLAVIFGVTFGALNSERTLFDLYVTEISFPKGAALLAFLAIGWILGGLLLWFLRVRRLQRELRTARRALHELREESALSIPVEERSGRA